MFGPVVFLVWATLLSLWQRDEYWRERGNVPKDALSAVMCWLWNNPLRCWSTLAIHMSTTTQRWPRGISFARSPTILRSSSRRRPSTSSSPSFVFGFVMSRVWKRAADLLAQWTEAVLLLFPRRSSDGTLLRSSLPRRQGIETRQERQRAASRAKIRNRKLLPGAADKMFAFQAIRTCEDDVGGR